jgi:hypothetical protein
MPDEPDQRLPPLTKAERERLLGYGPDGLPADRDTRGARLKGLTDLTEFADFLAADDAKVGEGDALRESDDLGDD